MLGTVHAQDKGPFPFPVEASITSVRFNYTHNRKADRWQIVLLEMLRRGPLKWEYGTLHKSQWWYGSRNSFLSFHCVWRWLVLINLMAKKWFTPELKNSILWEDFNSHLTDWLCKCYSPLNLELLLQSVFITLFSFDIKFPTHYTSETHNSLLLNWETELTDITVKGKKKFKYYKILQLLRNYLQSILQKANNSMFSVAIS